MRQLFIDLNDVLADFDLHHERTFGYVNDRSIDVPGFWDRIAATSATWFADLPVKWDAKRLWTGVQRYHPSPIILTGAPPEFPGAIEQKRAWVAKHFGAHVVVLCCESKDKCLHGKPGDVLIDDYPKYQHLWENMGGIFILHTSSDESLRMLDRVWVDGPEYDAR